MAENTGNLFAKLTRLFRSGPIVRRKVRNIRQSNASSALDVFRKAQSDIYSSVLSSYGSFDRMSRYSDFCLVGETLISTVDTDTPLSIKEIFKRFDEGINTRVFSHNTENNQLSIENVVNAWWTGVKQIWEIEVNNEFVVRCTDNHPFLLINGTYQHASLLRENDTLMPHGVVKNLDGSTNVYDCFLDFRKVTKITKTEKFESVYDITVTNHHNFGICDKNGHGIIVLKNSEMESTPTISAALDIYAAESTPDGEDGKVLHIYSDNRKIQEMLEQLFYDTLNVEFNMTMWVRNLVKYGDFFLFLDVSPEFGVINTFPISISQMEREEGFDKDDPMAVRFRWITQGNQLLENWQIAHFRLLGNDAFLPYGSSVLDAARRIWRQLILLEDAMMVYRIVRAPERRIFYIDVGNVPPEERQNYLEQAQTSLKKNSVVDKSTGKVDLRYNSLAQDEDYFIPVVGGESGTKIDTLAGGVNAAAIEDVEYFEKKLFSALKVPKAYLGYDENIGSKATLSQEDIKFANIIHKIQKMIISELNKIAMVHLYCNGFDGDELLDFQLQLNNPSSIAQLQKLELIKTKFEIAGSAPEGAVDREYIRKKILGLTDDEIARIKKGRKADKLEDAEIEKSGAAEGGDAGGGESPDSGGASGGAEDLFAGDKPQGDLLIGGGKNTSQLYEDDEILNDDELDAGNNVSIDDIDAPLKMQRTLRNVFNQPVERKRSTSTGPAKTEMPDLGKMVMHQRGQDTLNKPYDNDFVMKGFAESKESSQKIAVSIPRVTRDMQTMFKNMKNKIGIRAPGLISESSQDLGFEIELEDEETP